MEIDGYTDLKTMPDGTVCGLQKMMFTTALMVGINAEGHYERRYCYPDGNSAYVALLLWDGQGDPEGPWVKEKPGDRLGPGALQE